MRSPLDPSGPSALNNQLLNTTGSEAVYFKYVIVIQSDFLVVVIGWKVVNSGRTFSGAQPRGHNHKVT